MGESYLTTIITRRAFNHVIWFPQRYILLRLLKMQGEHLKWFPLNEIDFSGARKSILSAHIASKDGNNLRFISMSISVSVSHNMAASIA